MNTSINQKDRKITLLTDGGNSFKKELNRCMDELLEKRKMKRYRQLLKKPYLFIKTPGQLNATRLKQRGEVEVDDFENCLIDYMEYSFSLIIEDSSAKEVCDSE